MSDGKQDKANVLAVLLWWPSLGFSAGLVVPEGRWGPAAGQEGAPSASESSWQQSDLLQEKGDAGERRF